MLKHNFSTIIPSPLRRMLRNNTVRCLQKGYIDLTSEEDCEVTIKILQEPIKTKLQKEFLTKALLTLKFF
jgi:hypothetical protein